MTAQFESGSFAGRFSDAIIELEQVKKANEELHKVLGQKRKRIQELKAEVLKFNPRQRGTILAALRLWQETINREEEAALMAIATNDGLWTALTNKEIAALCERINR